MENSKIEWTTHTANLWWGCQEVNPGCDNCYARELSKRYGSNVWGSDNRIFVQTVMKNLVKWDDNALGLGEHHNVFVGSMMDIWERNHRLVSRKTGADLETDTDSVRELFFLAVDHLQNLNFLLLTKRPSNIRKYAPAEWYPPTPPRNVMLGVSVANQQAVVRDIQQLIEASPPFIPLFLSVEPLLEEISLERYLHPETPIKWVIVGGESGPKARPCHIEWIEKVVWECKDSGIPVFVKQMGQNCWKGGTVWPTVATKGNDISEFPKPIKYRQFSNGENGKGPLPWLE